LTDTKIIIKIKIVKEGREEKRERRITKMLASTI
jgi:hypothetical protein